MRIFLLSLILIGAGSCKLYKNPNAPKIMGKYPGFNEKDSLLGFLNENRTCFDVTYYELDITIHPEKQEISGEVIISFIIVKGTKKIQIDLDERMDIEYISDPDGKLLSFNRNHRSVLVDFNRKIQKGEKYFVKVKYGGKPQIAKKPPWKGGLVWKKKNGRYFVGVACEDEGSSIWWPSKDHISDKPDSVQTSFTVPAGYTCVSNGRLVKEQKIGRFNRKFTWRTSYPINQYNITFYMADYKHFQLDYSNEGSNLKKLDFYVLSENFEKAKTHFQQSIEIIEVYEGLFGPYPWWKDGYKLVESPYEGMEHQTAIAYGNNYKNTSFRSYDYIILHETAHEWWGNYITACDMSDLWIHEGFATYAEMLYEEKIEGDWSYTLSYAMNRVMAKNKRPVVGPMDVAYTNFNDGDIYYKGAAILHMLRKTINDDDKFFKIIYRFATEYYVDCVMTGDFISLVNEVTEEDYFWFFEQYIYRREVPEFLYTVKHDVANNYFFIYKWNEKNTNTNFKLPIKVRIFGEDLILYPTVEEKKINIKNWVKNGVSVYIDDFVIIKRDDKLGIE